MRKQYKLSTDLSSVVILQDYVIEKYSVDYDVCGGKRNHPDNPDFILHIERGDDCAMYFEIKNKQIVKSDEYLRELLSNCSNFRNP